MEWGALLVPFVIGAWAHWRFHEKIVWWEAVIPVIPTVLLILAVKWSAETMQTRDIERHGGWGVRAEYFEDWNEYIHRTCTRTTGSGKSRTTTTYDCSYVDYHPPKWQVVDSNGYVVPISQDAFEAVCKRFGNREFHDLHRHYYTNDGDEYVATWKGQPASLLPVTTEHAYENRVQVTTGVLAFPTVDDPKGKGLFEYPAVTDPLSDPPVLGIGPGASEAWLKLEAANATLGRRKEVRFWLLIFDGKPRSTGHDQESYWKGGNKNELVVCVGLAGGKISWCHPFCWSPDGNTSNDVMKINIRDAAERMKVADMSALADVMIAEATTLFQRKEFDEFKYLTVAMPSWAIVLAYIVSAAVTIGLLFWMHESDAGKHFAMVGPAIEAAIEATSEVFT